MRQMACRSWVTLQQGVNETFASDDACHTISAACSRPRISVYRHYDQFVAWDMHCYPRP